MIIEFVRFFFSSDSVLFLCLFHASQLCSIQPINCHIKNNLLDMIIFCLCVCLFVFLFYELKPPDTRFYRWIFFVNFMIIAITMPLLTKFKLILFEHQCFRIDLFHTIFRLSPIIQIHVKLHKICWLFSLISSFKTRNSEIKILKWQIKKRKEVINDNWMGRRRKFRKNKKCCIRKRGERRILKILVSPPIL